MDKDQYEAWTATRSKGCLRYCVIDGLLTWGVPMFIAMAFMSRPFSEGFLSKAAIVHYIVWPVAGLLYGLIMWLVNDRKYKKYSVANETNT